MSSQENLRRFLAMDLDFGAVSLYQQENAAYFCTPMGAEYIGWIGCDGVHFVLLPGDERVFCVDPMMGEEGKYVLPVGADFREFLSFLLYCRDVNPLSQLRWLGEERFARMLEDDRKGEDEELRSRKEAVLAALELEFQITPQDPCAEIKALQEAFDPAGLVFSEEYYETMGLENPHYPQAEDTNPP